MATRDFLDVGPKWYMATQVAPAIDTDLMRRSIFICTLAPVPGEMLFSLGIWQFHHL
jgi:hypothetical protein